VSHVEHEIGGHTYRFEKLGYRRARAVLVLLARVAAPALAQLDGLTIKTVLDADIGALGGALGAAIEKLDDRDLETITSAFAERCSVREEGASKFVFLATDEVRDMHFDRAGLAVYLAWLKAALGVTYGDFFAELRAAVGKPGAPAAGP